MKLAVCLEPSCSGRVLQSSRYCSARICVYKENGDDKLEEERTHRNRMSFGLQKLKKGKKILSHMKTVTQSNPLTQLGLRFKTKGEMTTIRQD